MPNFYFLNTGNTDFNTGSNWSDTDNGISINAVPAAIDNVFFTANSGDCISPLVSVTIGTLTCTGYTKTLTLSDYFIVNGNIVLGSAMKIASAVIWTHQPRLVMGVNASITTNGVIIPWFTTGIGIVMTLLDQLNAVTLTHPFGASSAVTYAGLFGWSVRELIIGNAGGNTITLQAGITYKVGKYIHTAEKGSAHGKIISSDSFGHVKAILTVTGEINIGYVDFTDIDASGGRPLYPFNGLVNNCDNIFTMTDIIYPPNRTAAKSFVN